MINWAGSKRWKSEGEAKRAFGGTILSGSNLGSNLFCYKKTLLSTLSIINQTKFNETPKLVTYILTLTT